MLTADSDRPKLRLLARDMSSLHDAAALLRKPLACRTAELYRVRLGLHNVGLRAQRENNADFYHPFVDQRYEIPHVLAENVTEEIAKVHTVMCAAIRKYTDAYLGKPVTADDIGCSASP